MDNNPKLLPREVQIAELLCKGLRDDEIAEALELSVKTIRNNLTAMYRVCKVRNRVEFCMKYKDVA